ncbi:Pr6Pr family membrane protein [Hydrotalea sp.]|uniref:Pr6Pr family membrane protein n=1 Tax=Hydrotalea sp. TaxID=2881279 RepID=UPI00258C9856|nr:Pr6Pr family membrane protein [Hydrotalea sp.]
MRKKIALFFSCIIWLSVALQLYLMLQNRVVSVPETLVRFFSFFTILTNTVAAVYFTVQFRSMHLLSGPGSLTAITVYITIVGLVYQIVLRPLWQPVGLQKPVDEMLHSVNPLLVIVYWYEFEARKQVQYRQILGWLIYPLLYLVYILIRGSFSGFYPYPFVNVIQIGWQQTLLNALILFFVFAGLGVFLIFLGKMFPERKSSKTTIF